MNRIARGMCLVACLLALAPAAAAGEEKSETERRLDEVLAELEAQRLEIDALKAKLAAEEGTGGSIGEAVKQYLESDEGKKALGKGPMDFTVSWKDGLAFDTADRNFSLRVGGRLQFDFAPYADADSDLEAARGEFDTAVQARRARIEFSGTIYQSVFYKLEFEFGTGSTSYQDNVIGYKGIPVLGNFQVGHFKQAFSLEELTSDKYTTFMERGLPNAFSPSYRTGFGFFNSEMDDRLNWAVGSFSDSTTASASGPWANNLAARVAGTPLFDKERTTLLHLGAAYQYLQPRNETRSLAARPEARTMPNVVTTGDFSAETAGVLGLEAAFVKGPLSIQGEWMRWDSDHYSHAGPGEDADFHGYYAFVSWFLTGESRPYRNGAFQRVRPKSNFDGKDGKGAWEVALRYSAIDLSDGAIQGGTAHDWTLGVNWYLNPNARVMVNYVRNETHAIGGVDILELRFAVDF